MEKLRFTFTVLGTADGKTNFIGITSIETPDGRIFDIPDHLKSTNKHTGLTNSEVFMKIKNSLKKRHQSRRIWIPLTNELRKIYLDAGENMQFCEEYLEEITEVAKPLDNNINNTAVENKNLGKIAERFLMEKFSSKTSNVNQWVNEFENECKRFDILQDDEKIEILKHLLEKQCLDWYSSMLIKLTVNSEWILWKNNFCVTYGNKGWSQVKYAFKYKYQAGSLLEYATKKEKLLLEVNKLIDTETMINLIVMGLPDYIIDKIDKESVKSTATLYNEIGKYEHMANKKNLGKNITNNLDYKGKVDKTKPCRICEKLNKGIRLHTEEKCWYKHTENYDGKKNLIKRVNNSVIDVELNNDDQKNE